MAANTLPRAVRALATAVLVAAVAVPATVQVQQEAAQGLLPLCVFDTKSSGGCWWSSSMVLNRPLTLASACDCASASAAASAAASASACASVCASASASVSTHTCVGMLESVAATACCEGSRATVNSSNAPR